MSRVAKASTNPGHMLLARSRRPTRAAMLALPGAIGGGEGASQQLNLASHLLLQIL